MHWRTRRYVWAKHLSIVAICLFSLAAAPRRPALGPSAVALQAALDRAGVSPGVIDGKPGAQTRQAVSIFQQSRGLSPTGTLDEQTRAALKLEAEPATRQYSITEKDAAGPFVSAIPSDLVRQGQLDALGYTTVLEALAERFHMDGRDLQLLNPGARFRQGDTIVVPNVEPMVVPAQSQRRNDAGRDAGRVSAIVVSRTPALVTVLDKQGGLLFAAPVTSGSEHDPLPIGDWKVTDVYLLPIFHYNPALFWDADPSHAKTTIKPGPNNPVGVAWIDINREHYGLHGAPEPRFIGRSTSHGCVRLTNWDIARLLAFVAPGTPVTFSEAPPALHVATDTRPVATKAADSADTADTDSTELARRHLEVPVQGVDRAALRSGFQQPRDGHAHEAIDIPAPRRTPVIAVDDGTIAKLFTSKPGGLTIYQFDPSRRYAYYYAHLDGYADGLRDGATIKRRDVLGYVGSTGNASPAQPHLHFAIFRLGPERRWWQGVAIDPYPILTNRPLAH